jgi:hypothetical protein
MPAKRENLSLRSLGSIREDRFTIFLTTVILIVAFMFQTQTSFAASSSRDGSQIPLGSYCSNPNPHCYAEIYWAGAVPGSFTQLEPFGPLKCFGCSGFINNEMWLADNNSSQCTSTASGGCWVESGIATYPSNEPDSCNRGADSTCLFWADSRAGSGGYHEHPLYNFGPDGVDLTPYYVNIALFNTNGAQLSGSTWTVNADVYNSSNTLVASTTGTSTNNPMAPRYITIGSELSDSRGWAANNYFAYNEWENGNGQWPYQTSAGYNGSTNSPPYGQWTSVPCNCSGNIGGVYLTYDH